MKKKKREPAIKYFIDGKPSTLIDVVESNNDIKRWKSFLESGGLQYGGGSADRYLKQKIGDYLSSREINKYTGISSRILTKWRNKGQLKAEQLGGRWYYSLSSVVKFIKSANIDDLR